MVQLLSGCGGGSRHDGQADAQRGNLRLQLIWPSRADSDADIAAADVDCSAYGIDTVQVVVLSGAGQELKRGGPYACTDGEATLEKVPAGDDHVVVVLGADAGGQLNYRGQSDAVSIRPDAVASVAVAVHAFVPQLLAGHDQVVMSAPEVAWAEVNHASLYELHLSTSADMSAAEVFQVGAGSTPYALSDCTAGLTYYWQVFALDAYQNRSLGSPVGEFSVTDVPQLIFPLTGQPVSTACPTTFLWSPTAAASGYRVYIAGIDTFDDDSVRTFDTVEAQWNLTGAPAAETLYWKVHARDSENRLGPASDIGSVPVQEVSLVSDLYTGRESSYPHALMVSADRLFFVARPKTPGDKYDFQLFAMDNGAGLPRPVGDITPSGPSAPFEPVAFGNWIYFLANDGTNGQRIWRSDGTEANTTMVPVNPGNPYTDPCQLTVFGDRLFFVARSADYGRELWVTDGSASGTRQVSDIDPGPSGSNPGDLTVAGNWLYFRANDGSYGYEPWRSDGWTTVPVADLYAGGSKSDPYLFTAVGDRVFFRANDGAAGTSNHEVWTAYEDAGSGSVLVEKLGEINTETSTANNGHLGNSFPQFLTSVNGTGLAFSAFAPETGSEPYIYDMQETTPAPRILGDTPGGHGNPANFTALGRLLFYTAADDRGVEQLWVSDLDNPGNPPENLSADQGFYAPRNLKVYSGSLFFSAFHGTTGRELWTSQGTPATTQLVADIDPGPPSSAPANLTVQGTRLIMTAFNVDSGEELFQLCR